MGFIGGAPGYHILRRIAGSGEGERLDSSSYESQSKLETLLGKKIWDEIKDRSVIDFGCGTGLEAVEMAQRGARRVIGIDIQERWLKIARERASISGVADRCHFQTGTDETADVIIALDSFEHFDDPAGILKEMRRLLKPTGCVLAAFGPTWYHPLGGHSFSVFPWAHLIFTEKALLRWRADFKSDGAQHFREVEGGLNQMTIRRFEKIVAESPFRFAEFEAVPINKLRPLANRLTREATTAIVKCKLVPQH